MAKSLWRRHKIMCLVVLLCVGSAGASIIAGWRVNSGADIAESGELSPANPRDTGDLHASIVQPPRFGMPADPLTSITVVPRRVRIPGYQRTVKYGEAWTDANTAPLGRNGCDTRDDILTRDLVSKTYKRTASCPRAVATGRLIDPYTGKTLIFVRGPKTSSEVQIDHIVPLAYSWDMGASTWTQTQRIAFANDPMNLVAVDGPANENKGDKPPAAWMPSNARFHCQYVAEFTAVARKYKLAIDAPSARVIRTVAARCK